MQTSRLTRPSKLLFWSLLTLLMFFSLGQQIESTRPPRLLITEIVANNDTILADEEGDYPDWLEIYNPYPSPVNLAGWSLTDDPQRPHKWPFPEHILAGHSYLVIFASGKDRRSSDSLHTNFRLNKAGGQLSLYGPTTRQFIEPLTVTYPAQRRDVAYGLSPETVTACQSWFTPCDLAAEQYRYFTKPTPGQTNASPTWLGITPAVTFNHQRGLYQQPFRLVLSTTIPTATIRYTLDGSAPNETTGLVYQPGQSPPITIDTTTAVRAITIAPEHLPSTTETHSYIFPTEVLHQPSDPAGWPSHWQPVPTSPLDYETGPVPADYEMDPYVINRYPQQTLAALQALPSLSIVTDLPHYDIYANAQARGREWERPASVELLTTDGRPGFQVEAGLRIQGGAGRRPEVPKHSFRLFFRGLYGAKKLVYPLFTDSPIDKFETLILRGGVNRSYAGKTRERVEEYHKLTTYTRDEWMRRSQVAMSGSGSQGTFVHLYLNGLYWGLYNLVERPDAAFMATYFGGQEEDWFAINHTGPISGDPTRLAELDRLAQAGQFWLPERYAAIKNYLDTRQLIDYLILNWYAGNRDWGDNNWYAGLQNPNGQLKYFMWDAERSWIDGADIFWTKADSDMPDQQNLFKPLFEGLMLNADFRMEFADRVYRHLFNDGPLTDENAQARWLAINDLVKPAIVAEAARWGDVHYEPPILPADWSAAQADVLAQMAGNVNQFISRTREEGYYPPIDPPTFNHPGGEIEAGWQLSMTKPDSAGQIYFTTDGSDPRLTGGEGEISPLAQLYHQPLIVTTTTHLKARLRLDNTWSALHEISFSINDDSPFPIQITEIMYHPLGGEDYEFLELRNIGSEPVSVAGFSFDGLDFTFPVDGSQVAAGDYVVLVNNPAAFRERYPGVPINGIYAGRLSNRGETIALKSPNGQVIMSITYDDQHGWPLSADGWGDSLVRQEFATSANDPHSWRVSNQLHGSPGRTD